MNTTVPFDLHYVQSIGKAVYFFAYYEWTMIYIIDRLRPGFVAEYSRGSKMSSGKVRKRFKRVLREKTVMVAENKPALDICYDEFASLIRRRNALIHAHPITDTPTGEQILNYQGPVSQAIADMKWDSDAVERFAMDVDRANVKASALLAEVTA